MADYLYEYDMFENDFETESEEEVDKTVVLLPKSIPEIQSKYFNDWSLAKILKKASKYRQSSSSSSHTSRDLVWKYCGGALVLGRSLDSVIILMAGGSGNGKSSTINSLFDEPNLCTTSSRTSQTKDPTMIRKLLKVTAESPAVSGYLSFVDVPGTFDTDSRNEAANMACIRKLKTTCVELANRKGYSKYATAIRKSVYPNIVLFVVKATDDRMEGPDSMLAKSLKAFRDTAKFIDHDKPNLIVVLTHVMQLPPKKEKHLSRLAEKIEIVKSQVQSILGISDVQVVPVENEPEDYDLEKDGDFYKLPNGQMSHLNLFEAMLRIFDKNGDLLGRLLTSWYFHSGCPEKRDRAEKIIFTEKLDAVEVATAAEELASLNISAPKGEVIPTYNFQRLAHGFCPVTEEFKPDMPLECPGELKAVLIENSKFVVPSFVEIYKIKSSGFRRRCFMEKEEYQEHMQHRYGIEAGYKLAVSGSSNGRWVNNSRGSGGSSLVSMVHEIQVATFSLNNPREKELSAACRQELDNLPDEFKPETYAQFQAFFSRWGSHIVIEQAVGGAVHVDCTVQQAKLTREQLANVEFKVAGMFQAIFNVHGGGYSHESQVNGLREAGISSGNVRVDGGNPPGLMTLETVTPEKLRDWEKTVGQDPAELKSSIKLYPYYNFLESGKKHQSLTEATKEYLSNKLSAKIEEKLNNNRNAISEKETVKTVQDTGSGCFPKGALVTMADGTEMEIEKLSGNQDKLKTVKFQGAEKIIKSIGSTEFCTYLDRNDERVLEYLVLEFENGRKLVVSEGHMIFEYLQEVGTVLGKQAKHFKVGESAVYVEEVDGNYVAEMKMIVKISREARVGVYAPLTTSGTLIVDGFLVASYADIDSFEVAQASMLPLKLWSKLQIQKISGNNSPSCDKLKGIHPYARFLMSVRKTSGSLCQIFENI